MQKHILSVGAISLILATVPKPLAAQSSGLELAAAVMIGMLAALIYTGFMFVRAWRGHGVWTSPPTWIDALIPGLVIVGSGVAGYLTYVETQAVQAVCGPVGDCNAVQASSYAKLFGVLPVGVLGLIGYTAILVVWLWGRFRSDRLADYAPLGVLGLAAFGVLFSVYLTYLELFVIRAVCMWCLASAVIMTLLMLLATPEAIASFAPEETESANT
jgi:uncharacterized membrane protein